MTTDEGVWLRPLRRDDAGGVPAAFRSNADMARQGDVATPADAERYVGNLLAPGSAHRPWVVATDDGLAGLVCVSVDEKNRNGWFWYWMAAASRGRGWMRRAAATVADWALAEGGLERLELGHRVNNPSSRTTNEEVVAAAREIVETAGAAGLTMQAVAERVGVRAPSLYKRFAGRDALLVAVTEAAIADLTERFEAAAPSLPRLATAYRAFAKEHPEAFRLMFTPSAPQGALQRSAEPVIRAAAAQVGEEHALDAARLLTAWATGFLQMELAGAFRLGGDVERAFEYGLSHLLAGIEQDG
ncbi:GNAT family N-acetyltransferase [Microbacterium sp. NPDC003461]